MVQLLTEVDVFGVLLPLWVLNPIQSSSHVFSLTNSTGKKKKNHVFHIILVLTHQPINWFNLFV